MNNPQFTISVQENSNKIIGSSEEKFAGIRPGSLIKIGEDDILYTVLNRENSFFIKNFTIKDPKTIIIDDNIGINLQIGDNVSITFKEYELLAVFDIIDGGENYINEEEINVIGGDLNIDIVNGITNPAILKISEIDSDGKIKSIGIKNKGKYLNPPDNPVEVSSPDGKNAKFELKFQECSIRNILERQIVNISLKENKSIIILNYSLPLKLTQGKLSVEKNHLILDRNYQGKTKTNLKYQIFKDFTPYLNLGLISKNSLSSEVLLNKDLFAIDAKFKEINDRLNQLENKT